MKTQILEPSQENIRLASNALKNGQIVGIPTETVYGLAGNALDPEALAKIFDAKKRPTFDPLIVHISTDFDLGSLVDFSQLSAQAIENLQKLTQAFWPGPLTLVLPKKQLIPDLATSGLKSVAIRMPRHPVAQALLKEVGLPLAAPSANRFGRISPTSASHVMDELKGKIQYIIDAGSCEIGVESTVVELKLDGAVHLLRPGGVSQGEIEKLLGLTLKVGSPLKTASPGMLENHYAPLRPLFLLETHALEASFDKALGALETPPNRLGVLLFSGSAHKTQDLLSQKLGLPVTARCLSPSGDLLEAAKNLFAYLRELDDCGADILTAEPCPVSDGIGFAISDRLKKAATK